MKRRRGPSSRRHLSRRTFLRGSAGGVAVALALPTLDAMLDSSGALADGSDLGDAPVTLQVQAGQTQSITLSLPNHESRTVQVGTSQSSISVRLRRRSGRGMAQTTMAEAEAPVMVETPVPMNEAPATMTSTTMSSGTDNRDPWAQ